MGKNSKEGTSLAPPSYGKDKLDSILGPEWDPRGDASLLAEQTLFTSQESLVSSAQTHPGGPSRGANIQVGREDARGPCGT